MVIAGIILFLLTASAVSLFLRYKGVRLAYIWMVFILTNSIVWLLLFIIQPEKISPLVLKNWIKIGSTPVDLILELNNMNWPISVSYFTILVSYSLTSIARLRGNKSLYAWVEMAVLVLSGWLVILAGDYWSILITWTLIDFVELLFYLRYKILDPDGFYLHFLVKFIGSMLLIYGISRSFQENPQGLFRNNIEGVGTVILLAAILHSGILSNIQKKSSKNNYFQVSLIFLRIISFTASFYVLTYISDYRLSFFIEIIIKILFFSVAIWGAYRWAMGSNESYGFQELLLAFGGMVGYLYLTGAGIAIVYWLIFMLMPIGWLFLYSDRDQRIYLFWFLCLFMMSGLPFSLTYQGLKIFLINSNSIDLLLITLPLILVIGGYIKHASKKRGKFNYLEPWYQVFYLIGLFLPLISMSAVTLKNTRLLADEFSGWWIGAVVLSLSIMVYFYQVKSENQVIQLKKNRELRVGNFSISSHGMQIISEKIYFFFENILTFISKLFEGAGGILWAVVFLALFLTILIFQRGS
jgi:hypothetical protein